MPEEPPAALRAPPLSKRVFAGFSLMLAQAAAAKLLTLAGQIVLAWYLDPDDFGVMGLAYAVAFLATMLQQAGFREILVQRQAEFARLATPAFWMSLAFGLAAAVLLALVAPAAAAFLHGAARPADAAASRDVLVTMLWILALSMPLNAVATVPLARLQNELRFRALTAIALLQVVATVVPSCLLAAHGFGALSFAIPVPLAAGASALAAWLLAPTPIGLRPRLRGWPVLAADNLKLLAAGFLFQFTLQGGALMLGLMHASDRVIGIYAFALTLSLQVTQLLTQQLGNALFPALARLGEEPARQRAAFLRAARCLALVGVPLCLLQAVTARPFLDLLFGEKWSDAAASLAVLSLGMSLQVANGPAIKFIIALGHIDAVLRIAAGCLVLYLATILAAASATDPLAISTGIAIYVAVVGMGILALTCRLSGAAIAEAGRAYLKPLALGSVAAGVASVADATLLRPLGPLAEIAAMGVIAAAIYIPLARLFAPRDCADLVAHWPGFLRLAREPS